MKIPRNPPEKLLAVSDGGAFEFLLCVTLIVRYFFTRSIIVYCINSILVLITLEREPDSTTGLPIYSLYGTLPRLLLWGTMFV